MANLKPAPQHLLIGLTGNIGCGKSLVRQMLEHLGALGVDADWLTRQASSQGAPGYERIVARFGKSLLDKNGEINRQRLGDQVFSDPAALADLENILHPFASAATRRIAARSLLPVVVIEAIKVLESDLAEQCQCIWVVDADPQTLYQRLERTRSMSHAQVDARLAQQTPAAQMKERADVVIDNSGDIASTWEQVRTAWQALPQPDWNPAPFRALQEQVHLLPVDEASLDQVRGFLRAQPDSLPALFLAAQQTDMPAPGIQNDMLLRDMLRFYFSAAQKDELAIWKREGFACQLGGYQFADRSSGEKLESLIKGIEALNAYYLCGQMSLPARREHAPMLARLGYEIHQGPLEHLKLAQKAGYNLYSKSNPDLLSLF